MAEDRDIGEGNQVMLVPIAEPWHVTIALGVIFIVISMVIALNALQPPEHALTAGQPQPAATPSPACDPTVSTCSGLSPLSP